MTTTTTFLLSRTLAIADYDELDPELVVVNKHGIFGQHEHRRWEYAVTLRAVKRWLQAGRTAASPLYDVGGGGSRFSHMLAEWTGQHTAVIDPVGPEPRTLAQFVGGGTALADIITCISVIEHVLRLDEFSYHLSCLLAPGGLLVLTMDYWDRCGRDTAQFAHTRERIFCPKTYSALRTAFSSYHLTTFGGFDPTFHGYHVHDYTFASLVLEKRR